MQFPGVLSYAQSIDSIKAATVGVDVNAPPAKQNEILDMIRADDFLSFRSASWHLGTCAPEFKAGLDSGAPGAW